jgi:hypothetical protein
MQTTCPKCGAVIEVELQKGLGAQYMDEAKKITDMCLNILKWWVKYPNYWMTKSEAYHQYALDIRANPSGYSQKCFKYKIGSFAARVSELVGIGLMSMTVDIRKLKDPETMSIRHPRKPRYKIADLSLANEVIRRGGYVFWIGNEKLDMRNQLISEVKPKFW